MKLLSSKDIYEKYGLTRKTCLNWERQNRFPKRVVLGPRKSGWLAKEIAEWEAARLRERECESEASDVV